MADELTLDAAASACAVTVIELSIIGFFGLTKWPVVTAVFSCWRAAKCANSLG